MRRHQMRLLAPETVLIVDVSRPTVIVHCVLICKHARAEPAEEIFKKCLSGAAASAMVSWMWDLSALPLLLLSLLLRWPPAHPPLCLPRTSALHRTRCVVSAAVGKQALPNLPDSCLGFTGLCLTQSCASYESMPAGTAASLAPS